MDNPMSRQFRAKTPNSPEMGKALAGVIGGAAGLGVGAAIAGLLIPGVGPVLAITLGAVAAGIGGAAAGGALEEVWTNGVPKDEVFFYEDALRQGRTLLVALSDDDEQLKRGRKVITESGAETLDAAREKWWIGLKDADEIDYANPTGLRAEVFRRGFETALEPEIRGRSTEEMKKRLQKRYPDDIDDASFQQGLERGRQYYEKTAKQ
jgi:outer membrane lipoprotein SlyB